MINKNIPIYLCTMTEFWNDKIEAKEEMAQHLVGEIRGRKIISPNKINLETINPKNFIELKNTVNIDELLIIDRLIGSEDIISVADHVNISGENFLRSKTPEGILPQFPDMSKIYNNIKGFEKSVVHTIGPKRFENHQAGENIIYSELVGLIAPVAHYVGIKISALGSKNIQNIIEKI